MNNTDNTDGRKVDWDKPIEAVWDDGRVKPATVIGNDGGSHMPWQINIGNYGPLWADANGTVSTRVYIRNVATPQEAEPIKWGEPIKVDGKRPEWLGGKDLFRWYGEEVDQTWYYENCPDDCTRGDRFNPKKWPDVTEIRLPHDHPHYATQQAAPAVPQEVVERMVKLVKDVSNIDAMARKGASVLRDEARAIVAMLEPVDEVLEACREICALDALEQYKDDADNLGANLAGHYRDGAYDDGKEMRIALAAYRRALAREAGE